MPTKEIEAKVIEVLKEIQQISGRPWSDLSTSSKPIDCLDGFDSLASIEATVLIEERFGCTIEQDTLFVSDDGRSALTFGQVCDRLAELVGAKGGGTR